MPKRRMPERRMPVKMAELDFADDGYPGFHAQRRTNAPIGLARRYLEVNTDTPEEEARRIILELFLSWDFVNEEGKEIPHTVEGIDLIPNDLMTAMHVRGIKAMRDGAMPAPLGQGSSGGPSEDEKG